MLEVNARLKQGDFTLDTRFVARTDAITALFGPSGAGKSTLLAVIAGLRRFEDGRIALNDMVLEDTSIGTRIPSHQRGIGLVFQDSFLFPHMNVRGNIAYAWRRAPHRDGPNIADIVSFLRLEDMLDRSVGNLSGGEKNRVALARALASQPSLLLLDEPFAALDGAFRAELVGMLIEAHRTYRVPMLVVTHSIDEAAALAADLVVLERGQIMTSGTMAEVSHKPEFSAMLHRHDIGTALPMGSLRSNTDTSVQNLWLRADQVLLSPKRPEAISARNIIEGRISDIRPFDNDDVLVELEYLFGSLLSRVTMDAVQELALKPGNNVWAIVKANSFTDSRTG